MSCLNTLAMLCLFSILMEFCITKAILLDQANYSQSLDQCNGNVQDNPSVKPNSKCFLGSPYETYCDYWRVSSIGLLVNNTPAILEQHVENFMFANCDTDTEVEAFGPDPYMIMFNQNCTLFSMGSSEQQDYWLHVKDSKSSYLPDNADGATYLTAFFNNFINCTQSSPLNANQGGVLYVVINLPCSSLCTEDFLKMQSEAFSTILSLRYIIKIMYMSDNAADLECLQNVFSLCAAQKPNYCSIQVFGKETMDINSPESINSLTMCQLPPTKKPPMGEVKLIMIITLPILCGSIVIGVCCFICIHRCRMIISIKRDFASLRNAEKSRSADNWEIKPDELIFEEKDLLGSGAFSTVFRGKLLGNVPLLTIHSELNLVLDNYQTDTALQVAVKTLPPKSDEETAKDMYNEINFMKRLGYHAHILSMLGCISTPPTPIIVLELCEYGNLLSFVRKHRTDLLHGTEEDDYHHLEQPHHVLSMKDLISFAWQVCDGMVYLSSHNIIHRDIAARNVLLTTKMVAKLGDFGLCRHTDSALYTARGGRLPIKWMAIESLKYYEFSTESDVWSFGVLLFEIFSLGEGPYPAIQPEDVLDYLMSGKRLKKPQLCPGNIYKIMKKCWIEKFADRTTFEEIKVKLTTMLNQDDESYGYIDILMSADSDTISIETLPLPPEAPTIVEPQVDEPRTFRTMISTYWKSIASQSSRVEESPEVNDDKDRESSVKDKETVAGRIVTFLRSVEPSSLFEIEKIAREYRMRGNFSSMV